VIEAYLESQAGRYSSNTLAIHRWWLEQLQQFAGDTELARLTPDDLTQWRQDLVWRPGPSGGNYSENTVHQAVGVVRRFFGWATEQGLVVTDPAAHLKTRRVPARPRRELTPGEARQLLAAVDLGAPAGSRDRAILGVLLETRITRPACAAIELSHVQLDTGALLTTTRRGRGRHQVHTLSTGLLLDLRSYLDFSRPSLAAPEETALFVAVDGRRLSPEAIAVAARTHARRAGVPAP